MEELFSQIVMQKQGEEEVRDEFLRDTFDISENNWDRITRLRRKNCSLDQKLLEFGAFSPEIVNNDGSLITGLSLAAFLFDGWDNPHSLSTKISEAIARLYSSEREKLEEELDITVPNIHVYRKACGLYNGNLEGAARRFGIQPSHDDWRESICLPLGMHEKLAFLLGVVWGDGYYCRQKKAIELNGDSLDHLFYENTLVPLIKELFNKDVTVLKTCKESQLQLPRINLSSKAITEYITNVYGFKKIKKDYSVLDFDTLPFSRDLPQVKKEEYRYYFVRGILAAMATFHYFSERNSYKVHLSDIDLRFMHSISELFKKLNLQHRYFEARDETAKRQKRATIAFYGTNCIKLYRRGYMVNPAHYADKEILYVV